jgi:cytochrome c oxidase cbb3-type subunit 3
MQSCAACHGPDGKGNQALGAPNLTDAIWLYDSSEATIADGINKGRHVGVNPDQPPMPAHKNLLSPARIQLVAAYVWSLSNPAPAK